MVSAKNKNGLDSKAARRQTMRNEDLKEIRASNREVATSAAAMLENAILKALQSNGDISRITVTVGVSGPKLIKAKCSLEMKRL